MEEENSNNSNKIVEKAVVSNLVEAPVFDIYHSVGSVFIRVIESKNLPKMDTFGSIDPYVVANIQGNKKSEEKKTLPSKGYNARWSPELNCLLQLDYKGFIYGANPQIDVVVYDKDDGVLSGNDDFVGKCSVPLSSVFKCLNGSEKGVDNWFDLTNDKGEKTAGSVRLQISYITKDGNLIEYQMKFQEGINSNPSRPDNVSVIDQLALILRKFYSAVDPSKSTLEKCLSNATTFINR